MLDTDQLNKSQNKPSTNLSERELQVIELVATGMTNQEISVQLEISKRTVDNHISNILNKTSTDNRVALVRWALQWGKVCIDEVNCCLIGDRHISLNGDHNGSLGGSLGNSLSVGEGLQSV